jgi:hypothetical protein
VTVAWVLGASVGMWRQSAQFVEWEHSRSDREFLSHPMDERQPRRRQAAGINSGGAGEPGSSSLSLALLYRRPCAGCRARSRRHARVWECSFLRTTGTDVFESCAASSSPPALRSATTPADAHAPVAADIPSQWTAERAPAQRIEQQYRAAVADWRPQRPPAPT